MILQHALVIDKNGQYYSQVNRSSTQDYKKSNKGMNLSQSLGCQQVTFITVQVMPSVPETTKQLYYVNLQSLCILGWT